MSSGTVSFQDSDIILLHPYNYDGEPDRLYIRRIEAPYWNGATIGNDYKVLLDRAKKSIIQISNEFYDAAYAAIEPSLVGDVLILGAGLQTIDPMLVTGTSWTWVEKNPYLASLTPVNGTIYEGDANDLEFLASLGPFDTILIDFPRDENFVDYDFLLNPGGTIIYFQI